MFLSLFVWLWINIVEYELLMIALKIDTTIDNWNTTCQTQSQWTCKTHNMLIATTVYVNHDKTIIAHYQPIRHRHHQNISDIIAKKLRQVRHCHSQRRSSTGHPMRSEGKDSMFLIECQMCHSFCLVFGSKVMRWSYVVTSCYLTTFWRTQQISSARRWRIWVPNK